MNPAAQRVQDVFVAAVKLPPDQWEAFLEQACGDDAELRREVSEPLQAHQQAGSFLDRPVAHVQATQDFEADVLGSKLYGFSRTLDTAGEIVCGAVGAGS
jgi:hypothetical protein